MLLSVVALLVRLTILSPRHHYFSPHILAFAILLRLLRFAAFLYALECKPNHHSAGTNSVRAESACNDSITRTVWHSELSAALGTPREAGLAHDESCASTITNIRHVGMRGILSDGSE